VAPPVPSIRSFAFTAIVSAAAGRARTSVSTGSRRERITGPPWRPDYVSCRVGTCRIPRRRTRHSPGDGAPVLRFLSGPGIAIAARGHGRGAHDDANLDPRRTDGQSVGPRPHDRAGGGPRGRLRQL